MPTRRGHDDSMISWLNIASVVVAGLSLRPRVRDLDDSEVTPAVRRLRQLLKARISGNERHMRIEGVYGDTEVAVSVDTAPGGAYLTAEVPSPRGVSFLIAPRINTVARDTHPLPTWTHPIKALYSEDLELASRLLEDASIARTLSRLAAEPRFSLALRDGSLKITGKVTDQLSDHSIPELVKDMARLVQTLGAKAEVKRRVAEESERTKRRHNSLLGAAGILCLALISVVVYWQHRTHLPSTWLRPVAIAGWHPIQSGDFDRESSAVVQQHGQVVSDRIAGDFSGRGAESGEALILKRDVASDDGDSMYRVIVQTDPPSQFDQRYPSVAFALKVSNRNLHKMKWIGEAPPSLSTRDAVLIVQQRSDARSGQLLLFDGAMVRAYQPEDYRLF